jgi:hypothetical protein
MMTATTNKWLRQTFLAAIPGLAVSSVVTWAEQNFIIPGLGLYDRNSRPWLNDVLECANIPGRYTFIKPVQVGGGTTAGEAILCYWIANWTSGSIGYYWPSDEKADDRWLKYTEKVLQSCPAVMARAPADRHKWSKSLIIFPHLNFAQLGVRTNRNVSSDTLRGIITEEMHDSQGGWEPGKLDKVYGRQASVWNAVAFNISNASHMGDQLHQAYEAGTQELWEVLCPGCKNFHVMRAKWQETESQLGGLRYDRDRCKRADGSYDYNKLIGTIRYQMPCGYIVHDTPAERRALSLSGRYGEPHNKGALPNHRSFKLEAVATHDCKWIDLIAQKHRATRALKGGDPSLFEIYQREQECIFWDIRNRAPSRPITLSDKPKDRAGWPHRTMRLAAIDRQLGRKELSEIPHFWILILDFDAAGNALVVYEAKHETEAELVDALRRHEVAPACVFADSSADTKFMYALCLRNGWNALKITGDRLFPHPDGSKKIWSEPTDLWLTDSRLEPTRENPDEEPEFFLLSKQGAFDRLSYLRSGERKFEVPSDVSEEFKAHFGAWSLEQYTIPATGEPGHRWKQVTERTPDHLYCCASYLAALYEMIKLSCGL